MQQVQMKEVEAAAEARSLELGRPGPPDAALDRLRADCLRFFEKVPEPPVYLRRDDPARGQARELLADGQELLARALSIGREPSAASLCAPLQDALRASWPRSVRSATGRLGGEEAGGACGGLSRVEFVESGGAELRVARGDFLAFLYTTDRELRAVVDLSSTKLLWVTRGGPCFLATAAFGRGAGELAAFRAFRDRVLMR